MRKSQLLSAEEIVEIQRLYAASSTSYLALACQFEVSASVVGRVVRGEYGGESVPRIVGGRPKLSAQSIETIHRLVAKNITYRNIAQQFHVSETTIARIAKAR